MSPRGQYSERRLATTSCDVYEANWNKQTDGQDHILSQVDALTKNTNISSIKMHYKANTILF